MDSPDPNKAGSENPPSDLHEDSKQPTAEEALSDLFWLLEEYSPTWYSEEHHRRAAAALLRSQ